MNPVVEKVGEDNIFGCYVAAYACDPLPGEPGAVGYYKVFPERVRSYFALTPCIVKGASDSPAASASEAAERALAAARWHLDVLFARPDQVAAEEDAWAVLQFNSL